MSKNFNALLKPHNFIKQLVLIQTLNLLSPAFLCIIYSSLYAHHSKIGQVHNNYPIVILSNIIGYNTMYNNVSFVIL